MRPLVSRFRVPDLGVGVGFRGAHAQQVLRDKPKVDWFEVVAENFLGDGGGPRERAHQLGERYPVIPHGVSLSLGSDGSPDHLRRLAALVNRLDAPWFSDHLCMTGVGGVQVHDLLPLPYTRAVIDHVVDRIKAVQDRLGRPFALENVSSYMTWRASEMPEWEFLSRIVERADCGILLDVNNVYVSAVNHGFDPRVYLDHVPADRVMQIHLAGHSQKNGYLLDTHGGPVCEEVWRLYAHTIRRIGSVSTLIEWDHHLPTFAGLQAEAERARAVRDQALVAHAA